NLAEEVSKSLTIPTIGIGAGAGCDGQVLVVNDMLGLTQDFKPKFLRRYLQLAEDIKQAAAQYVSDVKSGDYPNQNEQYYVYMQKGLLILLLLTLLIYIIY